jgi:hypothetical protein
MNPAISQPGLDDLRLPKTQSDAVWSEMERRVDELLKADVPPRRLRELSRSEGYQNLLRVVAAEAARRRRIVVANSQIKTSNAYVRFRNALRFTYASDTVP